MIDSLHNKSTKKISFSFYQMIVELFPVRQVKDLISAPSSVELSMQRMGFGLQKWRTEVRNWECWLVNSSPLCGLSSKGLSGRYH